jgi:hypothetical protein
MCRTVIILLYYMTVEGDIAHLENLELREFGNSCIHRSASFGKQVPYFSIDNGHLMYNAHPKRFRHSFNV